MGGHLFVLTSMELFFLAETAGNLLESAQGSYSSRLLFDWSLPDECDASDAGTRAPDNPNV